jgi:hypothetical protein
MSKVTKVTVLLLLLPILVMLTSHSSSCRAFVTTTYPSPMHHNVGVSFSVLHGSKSDSRNEKKIDPITRLLHGVESFLGGWNSGNSVTDDDTSDVDDDTSFDDAMTLAKLERAQKVWIDEATRLERIEKSVLTDPDLTPFVEEPRKKTDRTFMYREAHRHDSFLAEVEHAIDTDPDLSNIVGDTRLDLARKAKLHDTMPLHGMEDSIDRVPDLNFIFDSTVHESPEYM